MKEKDILVDYEPHQLVLYAEKSDESIGPVQTGSYVAKNFVSEFLHIMGNFEKEFILKLQKQEISPLYFYMILEELTPSELALRAGLPKRKVKKHLQPQKFHSATVADLKKYADVLNIPVANFFQLIATAEDRKWKMGYLENSEISHEAFISQLKTQNPLLVISKIEKTVI